ncbi:MAG: dienelactone hydrolase family protein [Elusimicrobia bacterium]|nr:dienelactone hydrolase family protein [Elusimicrobiota bacterium]
MTKIFLALMINASSIAHAEIKTQTIAYKHGTTELQGYLAYDDTKKSKLPGIIVVHEWKGHGDYVRRRAEMLAKLGYVAFAIDMYGKGIFAKDHQEAAKLAGMYKGDRKLMRERALSGLEVLKKQKNVDTSNLAAIGYCFGGTTVLELARAGAPLKGVASFHGALDTPMPAQPGQVKAKVLVLHGADDKHVNQDLEAFKDEMRNAKADWQLTAYGGAVHSFTVPEAGNDPTKGAAYNEKADKRSWQAMKSFFEEIFK